MNGKLLQAVTPLNIFTRAKSIKYPGGIRYPGGIVYYPRSADYTEPEITPSKLFRVERVKPVKHNPWKLKKILKELHIDEEERVTIVKNIPEINARLWKIKHLVKITPITFPYGEPTENDINHTVLKENGQCIVTKELETSSSKVEALDKFHSDAKTMDSETLKRDSRMKWNNAFSGGF